MSIDVLGAMNNAMSRLGHQERLAVEMLAEARDAVIGLIEADMECNWAYSRDLTLPENLDRALKARERRAAALARVTPP